MRHGFGTLQRTTRRLFRVTLEAEGGPRRPRGTTMLIAGNWKMFKGPAETIEFCDAFTPPAGVDVVVCRPYVSLHAAIVGSRA